MGNSLKKIKKVVDNGKKVRIKTKDTDLTFGIKNRKGAMVQDTTTFSCWHRGHYISFDAKLWTKTLLLEGVGILPKLCGFECCIVQSTKNSRTYLTA